MSFNAKRSIKWMITRSRLLSHVPGTDLPRVLVYHRFAPPGWDIPHRVSADEFAWQLDTIRRGFNVISLSECLGYFERHGAWPKKSIVITIDDGYRDMYQWAYPELAKRKLAATFFVTTRFIDGSFFLWPDRLELALKNTGQDRIAVSLGDSPINTFPLHDEQQKSAVWKTFSDWCISISNSDREAFIAKVEGLLQVPCPASPPSEYAASSWSELREMRSNGIEIGSHTVSHPILSKVDQEQLDDEISTSKMLIEQQLESEVLTFCYPNSAPGDINDTVVSVVREAGFKGAVFGTDLSVWEPYRIPRMGITNDRLDFLWKVQGGEFLSFQRKGTPGQA